MAAGCFWQQGLFSHACRPCPRTQVFYQLLHLQCEQTKSRRSNGLLSTSNFVCGFRGLECNQPEGPNLGVNIFACSNDALANHTPNFLLFHSI
eukprot:1302231-Pleurochrysis_carterae.AAC.1